MLGTALALISLCLVAPTWAAEAGEGPASPVDSAVSPEADEPVTPPEPDHSAVQAGAAAEQPLIVVASGGISKGAYQAGQLYVLVEMLRRAQREVRAQVAAEGRVPTAEEMPWNRLVLVGASAGSVNALLAGIELGTRGIEERADPEASLFFRTWVPLGLHLGEGSMDHFRSASSRIDSCEVTDGAGLQDRVPVPLGRLAPYAAEQLLTGCAEVETVLVAFAADPELAPLVADRAASRGAVHLAVRQALAAELGRASARGWADWLVAKRPEPAELERTLRSRPRFGSWSAIRRALRLSRAEAAEVAAVLAEDPALSQRLAEGPDDDLEADLVEALAGLGSPARVAWMAERLAGQAPVDDPADLLRTDDPRVEDLREGLDSDWLLARDAIGQMIEGIDDQARRTTAGSPWTGRVRFGAQTTRLVPVPDRSVITVQVSEAFAADLVVDGQLAPRWLRWSDCDRLDRCRVRAGAQASIGQLGQLAMTSGTFPVAFAPVPLPCTAEQALDEHAWTYAESAFRAGRWCLPDTTDDGSVLMIDGGLYENQPLRLGYELAVEEADRVRVAARSGQRLAHVVYPDPDLQGPLGHVGPDGVGHCGPGGGTQPTDRPDQVSAFFGMVAGSFMRTSVSTFVDQHSEGVPIHAICQRTSLASSRLSGFLGFYERSVRAWDFYVGMYDAIRFLEEQAAADGDASLPVRAEWLPRHEDFADSPYAWIASAYEEARLLEGEQLAAVSVWAGATLDGEAGSTRDRLLMGLVDDAFADAMPPDWDRAVELGLVDEVPEVPATDQERRVDDVIAIPSLQTDLSTGRPMLACWGRLARLAHRPKCQAWFVGGVVAPQAARVRRRMIVDLRTLTWIGLDQATSRAVPGQSTPGRGDLSTDDLLRRLSVARACHRPDGARCEDFDFHAPDLGEAKIRGWQRRWRYVWLVRRRTAALADRLLSPALAGGLLTAGRHIHLDRHLVRHWALRSMFGGMSQLDLHLAGSPFLARRGAQVMVAYNQAIPLDRDFGGVLGLRAGADIADIARPVVAARIGVHLPGYHLSHVGPIETVGFEVAGVVQVVGAGEQPEEADIWAPIGGAGLAVYPGAEVAVPLFSLFRLGLVYLPGRISPVRLYAEVHVPWERPRKPPGADW